MGGQKSDLEICTISGKRRESSARPSNRSFSRSGEPLQSVLAPVPRRCFPCYDDFMSEAAIRLHVEPLEEGGYVATSPDVPGLVVEGRSLVEVAEIARDVARKIAESCIEHGDPLPPALTSFDDSKPFEFTIPVGIG